MKNYIHTVINTINRIDQSMGSLEIIIAIIFTVIFYPYSIIFWIVRFIQELYKEIKGNS
jgi:hypothetical protein